MTPSTRIALVASLVVILLPPEVSAQPFPRNTNYSRKLRSAVVSGFGNLMSNNSRASVIAGGAGNQVNGAWYSAVGGGDTQKVSGENVTIAGGGINTAGPGRGATIGGGLYNTASAQWSTIPGGYDAEAVHVGSFVWGADPFEATTSFGNYTFTARCEGGARFYSADGTDTGPRFGPGGTDWIATSDSNLKTKITAVNAREILDKLSRLPVTEWEYKHRPDRRYIGPMSQDFHAIFGLGDDDKGIGTLDSDGVMYAALKGLIEELKERDEKIEELEADSEQLKSKSAEVEDLKARLDALERRVSGLPQSP